ncbi:MAG: membrane protein insertion efficiency factor YidD [Mycolicibacterium sp.]|uniref:membrane protein insertion efficiency factor YidD n=1 Tax=Mycolicibacterium sp. TaxID=2320850 RepID=UPI003D13DDF7
MTVRRAPQRAAVLVIQLYRHTISPLRPPTCRFTPTCSQYAVDALTEFGLLRGGWLAAVRLLKCGPWHRGGWDPIPDCGFDEAAREVPTWEVHRHGAAGHDGVVVVENQTTTVQQGESRTRV